MRRELIYYISKLISRIQLPSLKNCTLETNVRVGAQSNCIGMKMGRYSYLGKASIVHNVSIGRFCSVANYCSIGGGRHEMGTVSTSPVFCSGGHTALKRLGNLPEPEQPTTWIGNDVWIGEKCFVKAGIRIGDGAVVGAHSVVTRDVPPYAIVAGSPARILRYRFDEQTIAALLEMQWWNWEEEKIKRNASLFDSPERLIAAWRGGQLK